MIYLLNKKVDEKSPIKQALMQIFGVGPFLSDFFCKKVGVKATLKLEKVTSKQRAILIDLLTKDRINMKQEELSRFLYENVARLVQIRSYRGLRHRKGLPCRGQRTRTNSTTVKRQNKKQNRLR
jgi:small subunit ribosomal protein S13